MIGVIQATQEQEITLDSNTSAIPFAFTDLRCRSAINCRSWMNHNDGSALFSILDSGYYDNNFGSLITSATPGIVAVGLFADGTYIEGTRREANITSAGEWHSIGFEKEIQVCCKGKASITVRSLPTSTYEGTVTETQIPTIKSANFKLVRDTAN